MEVKLFNSLTNRLETFKSIAKDKVSMYVCGSTAYSSPHIGNLRPVVVFDVLRRLFIYLGYEVTYVSNFTDVDDKIIKKAIEENVDEMVIANRYIAEIKQMVDDIHSLAPTYTPRVSEYIKPIINYINKLVETNHAYVVDGDVYFKVDSIDHYGELAKINLDELKVGARVEKDDKKKSPLDFALWKKTTDGVKWSSPWGEGRPGWHTECCVMIDDLFPGGLIDIHGGGFDLKFPHHTNEIAQHKASHKNKLANYWLHNGFVTFGDNKMSKSLGNVILAKDAIKQYGGNVVRLALLSSHYRAPVKFTEATIKMAQAELTKFTTTYSQLALALQKAGADLLKANPSDITPFISALADDLNVSNALTYLHETLKNTNSALRSKTSDLATLTKNFVAIKTMFKLLGLAIDYPVLSDEDKKLLADYQTARKEKNYQKSDELRGELLRKHLL
ncbi:MAG: cysteine--tRNA ligase [Bacilli bacterium]|nr:cysteine--tRNA ligase [Bacilli bacterium]